MFKLLTVSLGLLLLSGCTRYGVIDNVPLTESTAAGSTQSYSFMNYARAGRGSWDIELTLAFSGGGTRAAALAYGVLEELRDTMVVIDGQPRRLLDEVDFISSVSGGSFTSAYYGLHGDGIFEDYKDVFLVKNIQGKLVRGMFNPFRWFSRAGRTEMAVKLYDKEVFQGATFADMQRAGGPLVVINASDLGYGGRFAFIQEYFNLLCSDIASFPVARAVTASSAVPLVFPPIVVENYHDCKSAGIPDWLTEAKIRQANDHDMTHVLMGLESYYRDSRQYVHLVDGGITGNLGLRAVYELVETAGGAIGYYGKLGIKPPRYAVLITVNASTAPEPEMDKSNKQPSAAETISAMSNVQLSRYNDVSMALTDEGMREWAKELSTPDLTVTPYHVQVRFMDVELPEEREYYDLIPTSFSLSEEQVDRLILVGRELLRNNPDFQRFLVDFGGVQTL